MKSVTSGFVVLHSVRLVGHWLNWGGLAVISLIQGIALDMSEYDSQRSCSDVSYIKGATCMQLWVLFFMSYSKTDFHVVKSQEEKKYIRCFNYHTL